MKKSKKRILSTFAFLLMSLIIFAQNTIVNIYPNVKHQVGDISEFDRAKYINLHSTLTDGDWAQQSDKLEYMMSTLDVHLGRDNGIMGSAMNYAKEDALKPGYADSADLVAQGKLVRDGWKLNVRKKYENNSDMMIGGQENPHWPGKVTKSGWTVASSDAVGDFMGRFLNSYYRNDNDPADSGQKRPKYLEVINEPLYGLVDNGEFTPIDVFNHHNAVADAIRRHNKDVKIGGFTLAFPDFDKDNFKNWEERMKLFIDVAGDKMDFFSIHMYDFNKHHFNNGTNFDGPVNFKGSRAEATIDLVENYSKLKLGYVKPLLF